MAISQNIVNQSLMAEYSTEFNLGCDVLGKGNRLVEKELGASKMSGDTVQVPIYDSGKVYDQVDISTLKGTLGVARGQVPVSVRPIVAAAEVEIEDLTLCIEEPKLMEKRVANLQDEVNKRSFNCLVGSSKAYVAAWDDNRNNRIDEVLDAAFAAEAGNSGSKIAGTTYGMLHPRTWNYLCRAGWKDMGGSNKAESFYKNELGNLLGLAWSKGSSMNSVTAVNMTTYAPATLTQGLKSRPAAALAAGTYHGQLSQPFQFQGVYLCDALGKPTSELASFYFVYIVDTYSDDLTPATGHWELDREPYFEGPRKWLECEDYVDAETPVTVTAQNVLQAGCVYLPPAVMWKENDFLIAVKGLAAFHGLDSFTVPTVYSDKGIMPLRGTCISDGYSGTTLFRTDALFGFKMFQGVSNTSIWIPISGT